MTDEPLDDEVPEGPRRKTFEPLSDDVVFTGAIPVVDDAPDDAPADEPASIPDPPVRTSLAESAILEKFGDPHAGSTADMMAELEKQVAPSRTATSVRSQGAGQKSGKVYSERDMANAWTKVRNLNARGSVDEAAKLEAELTAAYLEGRVRG